MLDAGIDNGVQLMILTLIFAVVIIALIEFRNSRQDDLTTILRSRNEIRVCSNNTLYVKFANRSCIVNNSEFAVYRIFVESGIIA